MKEYRRACIEVGLGVATILGGLAVEQQSTEHDFQPLGMNEQQAVLAGKELGIFGGWAILNAFGEAALMVRAKRQELPDEPTAYPSKTVVTPSQFATLVA